MTAQGNPISYRLSIDWANTGAFPDNGDTPYLRSFSVDRGREQTFEGDPRSNEAKFARNKVGQLILTLDNDTRRYDTYNSVSPLYPNVIPGKVVQLQITDDFGTTYTIFTGTIDDIRATGYTVEPRVIITCSDAWKQLSQAPISTQMYLNSDISSPMSEIAAAAVAQGSLAGSVINKGSDVFPYIWGDETIPYQALHDFAEMDGGYCWIDAQNLFRFLSRVIAQAQTPVLALNQSQVLNEPVVTQPWDNIINQVVIAVHDLTLNPFKITVWTTQDVATLLPSQKVTRRIEYTGLNGKKVPLPTLAGHFVIINPANGQLIDVGTSFNVQLNSSPDGTGTILFLTINSTRPPGGAVALQVVFQNNSAQTGYLLAGSTIAGNLSGGKLVGNSLDDRNPSEVTESDPTSLALYKTRLLRLDHRYMQGAINAKNVANAYLTRFKDPQVTITVEIVNRSNIQFAYDLNTLMNFTSTYFMGSNTKSTAKAPTAADTNSWTYRTIWFSPSSAFVQDNVGAYTGGSIGGIPVDPYATNILVLTGFGFNLPPTAVVKGISIRVRKKGTQPLKSDGTTGGSRDYIIELFKGVLNPVGNNKADLNTLWPIGYADFVYGGPTDLWGTTLTPADVNSNGFGVGISAFVDRIEGNIVNIDYVEMTVYVNDSSFKNAFRLVGIKHATGATPKEVKTTWILEPSANSSGLRSPNQVISSPSAGEQFPMLGGFTY